MTANEKRLRLFKILFTVIAVAAGSFGLYWWLIGSHHVSTDNAYVNAEIAQVTPSVGGTIMAVNVIDTQRVTAGDVLVTIDDTDTKLAFARAQAELARLQTNLDRAKIDYQRRISLAKSGSVSGEELTTAENAFRAAEAAFDAGRIASEQAQVDLDRTVIRAPIDGVVARRSVQLGQRVQAGTPLLSIVPMDQMHVNANFKEVQLEKVRIGQPVTLHADLYGNDVTYHGKVAGMSGGTGSAFAVIPAQNATGNWIKVVQRLPVRIDLDPAELREHPLQVGLSMSVDIDISADK